MGKSPPAAPAIQPPPEVVIQDTPSVYTPPELPTLPELPTSNLADRAALDAETEAERLRQENAEAQKRKTSIASTIVSSPLLEDEDPKTLSTILG